MKAAPLAPFRTVRGRFARSTNIERDAGAAAVEGYLPTGRSMDAVRRFAMSLDAGGRALSITGPYGSGKSSFAVFLDAIVQPTGDLARRTAEEICAIVDPEALALLDRGRRKMGGDETGFVCALVTAEREPVTLTILRALRHGTERFDARTSKQKSVRRRALALVNEAIGQFGDASAPRPTAQEVRQILEVLASLGPILLLIDEFGKNLEGYADDPARGDLYVLQQLAEWTGASAGLPLVVITMQHLAFADYLSGASDVQRRELAKIQGRFEDIPFIDSAQQTRRLIAAAWTPVQSPRFEVALTNWAAEHAEITRRIGLSELLGEAEMLAGCWPLHPVAQLVLPELCARYGQNERTLFSFLASREPASMATFLSLELWDGIAPLPSIGVDRIYDYFIESAGALVGVSQSASRWLEIETMVRDTLGLTEEQRRAVKTIGVLNLVSAGGGLRASRATAAYALTISGESQSFDRARQVLDSLEARGLVTFRDFADEYRLWQGSDYDLRSAVEAARRRLRLVNPADVLADVMPLTPVVAGRHSQQTHTLRAFARSWVSASMTVVSPPTWVNPVDGMLLYVAAPEAPLPAIDASDNSKPIVAVVPSRSDGLVAAAVEVAALQEVLATENRLSTDWVVRRELSERIAAASQRLDAEFEATFSTDADMTWVRLGTACASNQVLAKGGTLSCMISSVADDVYRHAPQVRNEMLNRTELTSQGAKARRQLLEAMVTRAHEPRLGISGFGPERAMYEAALSASGLHRRRGDRWGFYRPGRESTFTPAWDAVIEEFNKARLRRVGLDEVLRRLCTPPIGMRPGAAVVLLTATLIAHADEVAIYEHGTYRPILSPELSERMVRNPIHFEVKHFAAQGGIRAEIVANLMNELSVSPPARSERNGSLLAILRHLVTQVLLPLPEYARRTNRLSSTTLAVRTALMSATEPDQLLFEALPEALEHPSVPLRARRDVWQRHSAWVRDLGTAIDELTSCYRDLLDELEHTILESTGVSPGDYRAQLAGRAASLESELIDPQLRAFVASLQAPMDRFEWLEYVGLAVAKHPPAAWSDDVRARALLGIQELGAAFRRIEALHYDRMATLGPPANAVRLTLTFPDGQEQARLLWVDKLEEEAIGSALENFLARATSILSSDVRARDVAIALLVSHEYGWGTESTDERDARELKQEGTTHG